METVLNVPSSAATDEPAVPSTEWTPGTGPAFPRISEALVASAVQTAVYTTADIHPGRAQRHDGWTPERITTFLSALAQCGCVEVAANAAGMTRQGAYALRNRAGGRAFALAWDAAAEQLAHARVADEVRSRALHGCVEVIVRDGKVWGERHRFDNRLTMALLTRLDAKRDSRRDEDVDARIVAGEFDQFVAIAARGDVDAAAEFLEARRDAGWTRCEQARLLTRLGNYQRYGVGLPEEIPVDDLDATDPADWTEEQVERAYRAEILEDEEDQDGEEDEENEEYEEYAEDEGAEFAAEAEPDGPMATGNFVNFTPPVLPIPTGAGGPHGQGRMSLLASTAPYAIATAHCSRLYSQMCQALAASAAPRGTKRHAFGAAAIG